GDWLIVPIVICSSKTPSSSRAGPSAQPPPHRTHELMARPRTDIRPRILLAARERFLESGVDGASLRAIARDAKTSIGMIYYYFPTKDDLFFAVVEESYEKILAELERVLSAEGTIEERLTHLYERIADATDEEAQTVHLVGREALMSSARRDRLVQRFTRGHVALIFRAV